MIDGPEIEIGTVVEWGPVNAPLGYGVVRYFRNDGARAYIKSGAAFYEIPVAELRIIEMEDRDGDDLHVPAG